MAEQHEDSNLGSVAQNPQARLNNEKHAATTLPHLAPEPVRTGDAPPVAAPGAQSTNTLTLFSFIPYRSSAAAGEELIRSADTT